MGMREVQLLGTGLMQALRWLVPGDTPFAIGAIGFVVFVFGLRFGYSLDPGGGACDGGGDSAGGLSP